MDNLLSELRIRPAQMAEYDDVETFYRTLIESMRNSEFTPVKMHMIVFQEIPPVFLFL